MGGGGVPAPLILCPSFFLVLCCFFWFFIPRPPPPLPLPPPSKSFIFVGWRVFFFFSFLSAWHQCERYPSPQHHFFFVVGVFFFSYSLRSVLRFCDRLFVRRCNCGRIRPRRRSKRRRRKTVNRRKKVGRGVVQRAKGRLGTERKRCFFFFFFFFFFCCCCCVFFVLLLFFGGLRCASFFISFSFFSRAMGFFFLHSKVLFSFTPPEFLFFLCPIPSLLFPRERQAWGRLCVYITLWPVPVISWPGMFSVLVEPDGPASYCDDGALTGFRCDSRTPHCFSTSSSSCRSSYDFSVASLCASERPAEWRAEVRSDAISSSVRLRTFSAGTPAHSSPDGTTANFCTTDPGAMIDCASTRDPGIIVLPEPMKTSSAMEAPVMDTFGSTVTWLPIVVSCVGAQRTTQRSWMVVFAPTVTERTSERITVW
eukprot:Rhum_TRINITY_DN11193_c0_g6::Rhum_TRINITY_DN11193_c0_g6_i1::g.43121::m.43121